MILGLEVFKIAAQDKLWQYFGIRKEKFYFDIVSALKY